MGHFLDQHLPDQLGVGIQSHGIVCKQVVMHGKRGQGITVNVGDELFTSGVRVANTHVLCFLAEVLVGVPSFISHEESLRGEGRWAR